MQRFYVRQKITLMVNRYEVLAANPDGSEGALLAFAQQKRMAFKEQVTFYADESRSRPVFSFKARQGLDVRAEHDVFDENGRPLGYFRKDFAASLVRSTWHLSAPGIDAVGQERRLGIAILRRVWDFIPFIGDLWVPFVFHFDFADKATGAPVLTSERQKTVRDRYTVTVHDPRPRLPRGGVDGGSAGRAPEPLTDRRSPCLAVQHESGLRPAAFRPECHAERPAHPSAHDQRAWSSPDHDRSEGAISADQTTGIAPSHGSPCSGISCCPDVLSSVGERYDERGLRRGERARPLAARRSLRHPADTGRCWPGTRFDPHPAGRVLCGLALDLGRADLCALRSPCRVHGPSGLVRGLPRSLRNPL